MRATVLFFILLAVPQVALAQSCPEPLASARRLVLVTAATLKSTTATVERFERDSPKTPWKIAGGPATAMIGYKGVASAYAFRKFARGGGPVKVEGDKRAPAGFYKIGRNFGIAVSQAPNHMRLVEGTVCVEDLASPAYNTITSRAIVGAKVYGENMWRTPEYARGLLVDYPTDRKAHAGPAFSSICNCPERPAPAAAWRCVSRSSRPYKIFRALAQCCDLTAPGAPPVQRVLAG